MANKKLINVDQISSVMSSINNKISAVASAATSAIAEVYNNIKYRDFYVGRMTWGTSAWTQDTTITHAYKWTCTVGINEVGSRVREATHRADVIFDLANEDVIAAAEVASIAELINPIENYTRAKIRIYAKRKPTANISGTYYIYSIFQTVTTESSS